MVSQMLVTFSAEAYRSAHPRLRTQIAWNASDLDCALQLVSVLPVDLIVDGFQLQQLHSEGRLSGSSVGALRIRGHRDLEAPVYKLEPRDSIVVLDLPREQHITVDLPVHLRYQAPRSAPSLAAVLELQVQPPFVVETCPRRGATKASLADLPLEAIDMLRDNGRIVGVKRAQQAVTLYAPAGAAVDLVWVEPVHLAIIWLAFLWLLVSAWRSR